MKTIELPLNETVYEQLVSLADDHKMPAAELLQDIIRIYLIQESA